ncbi:glycosyltransferase [Hwangdonia lutea]|uniref:Glycosyltransferase n=1 Tax=Hwangdonia lutea TaxID=3075823 RepID=A0AA97EMY9_9FLAO|nr:glycosyltransferase [Hwangdonia sp. SCSIO 19198]WOD43414.1 glycosyltransferase [Hwangdonia sp. SCSIO 19198]
MKLSVLIPMYNVECYIEKCLASLLNQGIDAQDYEIIIVNDGSADNSLKIAEAFSKNHSNIFVHSQENRGAVFTRNKMLKLARGEYIYFVDADDYVAENALNTVLDYAVSNQLDLVGFDTLVARNRKMNKVDAKFQNTKLPKIITGNEFLRDNKNLRIEIWWYFVKRDFLNKHQIAFDRIDYDGDVVFTLKLFLKAKKVAYFPAKIYRYFQSPESTVRSASDKSKKRIIDYFVALIDDFSKLIDEVKDKENPYKKTIIGNFKFRRDVFVFFTITKMVKANLSFNEVKRNLIKFEAVGAYPIKHFNAEEFSILRYKVLKSLINNKLMLYLILKVYHSKFRKYVLNPLLNPKRY